MRPLSAQQEHDLANEGTRGKNLAPHSELKALLDQQSESSSSETSSPNTGDDWEAQTLRNHPGLTREKLNQMVDAFGF